MDSSGLVKLITEEPEQAALLSWLDDRPDDRRITSDLSKVEVMRAVLRFNAAYAGAVLDLFATISFIPLESGVLRRAGTLAPLTLRSLDAIHLASALTLGAELTAFVAYDRRLQDAARAERLPVVAPA